MVITGRVDNESRELRLFSYMHPVFYAPIHEPNPLSRPFYTVDTSDNRMYRYGLRYIDHQMNLSHFQ